jgi:hypothetical protein
MQQVGVPFGIKLTAQDTRNNTVTGFSGTVQIGSNRTPAGDPLTSDPFTAGVLTQPVTLTQAGLLSTITVTQTNETGGTVSGSSNAFTVLTPDGSGSLATPTGYVRNGSAGNTLTFTYTAPAGGMVNGALSLDVPDGWPDPSTSGSAPGYFVTNIGTKSTVGRTLIVSGVTRSEGQTVVITYGARAGGGPGATAPTAAGLQSWVAKSKMLASGSLAQLASSPAVNVLFPRRLGLALAGPDFVDAGSSGNTIVLHLHRRRRGMVNGRSRSPFRLVGRRPTTTPAPA